MDFDLGKWVKDARKNAGLSQEELALKLDYKGKGSISAFETNTNEPPFNKMVSISKICNYPLPYQIQATGAQFGDNATIGCSNNFSVNQFSSSLKNENHPDYTMPDDSMSPVLPKGCGLWINQQDKERINGKIYRIDWQGAELVRQLFFDDPAQIRLHAHNSQYPDKYVPKDQIRIMGRVVSWQVDDY